MKKYILTTSWEEEVTITEGNFKLFMKVMKTDDNIHQSEIFSNCGWKYVAAHLEDITDKNIEQLMFDDELDQGLEDFFAIHLFGPLENTEPFSEN